MCYEQDYQKVINAKAIELSWLINPCSMIVEVVVIHSPTASITTETPTMTTSESSVPNNYVGATSGNQGYETSNSNGIRSEKLLPYVASHSYDGALPLSTVAIPRDGLITLGNRERVTFEELSRLDPQLAGLYQIGYEIIERVNDPGAAYLLAHTGRELGRGVIRLLADGEAPPSHEEDEVAETEGNRRTIGAVLGLPPNHASVTAWFQLNHTFANTCHYRSPGPSAEEVRRAFLEFSELLYGRIAPYFTTHTEVDQLLVIASPTDTDVDRARGLLVRPQLRRYFFSHLEHPNWLAPLIKYGYFKFPPEQVGEADGTWRMQTWHESEYLVRVASYVPEQVTQVLLDIPSTLKNPAVWLNVAKAAKVLPIQQSVRLVPLIERALRSAPPVLFPHEVIDIVRILAEQQEKKAAFRLAEALLWLRQIPKTAVGEEDVAMMPHEQGWRNRGTEWMLARLSSHELEEFFSRVLTALESLDPLKTLKLLANCLDRTVHLMRQVAGDESGTQQSSQWWCEQLYETQSGDDVRALFAVALTGVAIRTATRNAEEAQAVWKALSRYSVDIFDRVRLVILTKAGMFLPTEINRLIGSDVLLEPAFGAREVAAFLRVQFANASPEAKYFFAYALNRGPSTDKVRHSIEFRREYEQTDTGQGTAEATASTTTEDIAEVISTWQQRRLRWFHDLIPNELQALAKRLNVAPQVPTLKQQGLDEVGFYSGDVSWTSCRSPKTVEELAALETHEILSFLQTWHPEGSTVEDFSYERLEDSLTRFATEHTTLAVELIRQGLKVPIMPGYISAIFVGLCNVVKEKKEVAWNEIISLALQALEAGKAYVSESCIEQGKFQLERTITRFQETEWHRVVRAAADLVCEGCRRDMIASEITINVWRFAETAVFLPITWTNTWGSSELISFSNVLTASYNTAAGDITRMLLEVALWDYRHAVSHGTPGMAERPIPRVEKLLVPLVEHVLSQHGRAAQGAHAALGRFIPHLYLLAPEWMSVSGEALFHGGLEDPIRHPVWNAYMTQSHFYSSTFTALRSWYVRAAESACAQGNEQAESSEWSATKGLIKHVLIAVTYGLASIGDEDKLVEKAFSNVPVKHRTSAYWSVFRSWSDSKEPVLESSVRGIVTFWEWRLSEIERSQATPATAEEAVGLMWLFRTPYISPEDTIRLGRRTVVLCTGNDDGGGVAWERLSELAQINAAGTFEIIQILVERELKVGYAYLPYEMLASSLRAALHCTDPTVCSRAERLIHKIGDSGHTEFGTLLHSNLSITQKLAE